MSHCRNKRLRSSSSVSQRKFQQNRTIDRSKDYDRRVESYEPHRHHHSNYSASTNREQYNYRRPSDLTASIDEIISNAEEYSPVVQLLVREILLERKKHQLIGERLDIREHDYAILHAQHEQTINIMALLKRDYDQCRLDLKDKCIELNEVRHNNHQLRTHIDHLVAKERQQMYSHDTMIYEKRQRRH